MKIGTTEKGDAGLNPLWFETVTKASESDEPYDAVICTTKDLNDRTIEHILACQKKTPIIVHAVCTGMGGTVMEPSVPPVYTQLSQIIKLMNVGFPCQQIVLEIDPIIPTPSGIALARNVLVRAQELLGILPACRCRVGVYKEYQHTKRSLREHGLKPFFEGFYASQSQMIALAEMLEAASQKYNIQFEVSNEPVLSELIPEAILTVGLCPARDMEILRLSCDTVVAGEDNIKHCLRQDCKQDLLSEAQICTHDCIYCPWLFQPNANERHTV